MKKIIFIALMTLMLTGCSVGFGFSVGQNNTVVQDSYLV
jgi:uncharacterized protein YcfL